LGCFQSQESVVESKEIQQNGGSGFAPSHSTFQGAAGAEVQVEGADAATAIPNAGVWTGIADLLFGDLRVCLRCDCGAAGNREQTRSSHGSCAASRVSSGPCERPVHY